MQPWEPHTVKTLEQDSREEPTLPQVGGILSFLRCLSISVCAHTYVKTSFFLKVATLPHTDSPKREFYDEAQNSGFT